MDTFSAVHNFIHAFIPSTRADQQEAMAMQQLLIKRNKKQDDYYSCMVVIITIILYMYIRLGCTYRCMHTSVKGRGHNNIIMTAILSCVPQNYQTVACN